MRSPIQDANAGATMDVAPTKKYAERTAVVAKQNNNNAQQRAQQITKASSALGQALGNFMEGKRKTELEQRYSKAFHEQGTKQGMTEYQKDLKRTGFTEFIYGGQSPEYLGALDASARNAANAMYIEEAEFAESAGADMTPEDYQNRLAQKITDYNLENFEDAPDAAFAFMKNWQAHSNELSRQQVKNFEVRKQEKARQTVADGFQTDFDVYKTLVNSNPDKAVELGRDMFSGKYKPKGMSDEAYRGVILSETMTAARAGDFVALDLFNKSGMKAGLNDKELKEYSAVQGILDTDNFNMLEAARLDYEQVIENTNSTSAEVSQALQRFDSAVIQVAARNTGSSKHIKTVYGADRWRTVLNNQYQKSLEDKFKAYTTEQRDKRKQELTQEAVAYEVSLQNAPAEDRRRIVAERADYLFELAYLEDDPELKMELQEQFIDEQKKLNKWESEDETRRRKQQELLAKKEEEERQLEIGATSLITGGGYVAPDAKSKKAHLSKAVTDVASMILPDKDMKIVDKMEAIFSDPLSTKKFMDASGKFGMYLTDSTEAKTAITNLGAGLRATNENNVYTPEQKKAANVLSIIRLQNPDLYNASFSTAEERMQVQAITDAIAQGKGIVETNNKLNTLSTNTDVATADRMSANDFTSAIGLSNAPSDVQDMAFTEYKRLLPLGSDQALRGAQEYMSGLNPTINGRTIKYGGSFGKIGDHNLEDVLKIVSKTYKSGSQFKSGLTEPLQRLVKNSRTKDGETLYSLDQVPGVQVSVYQGNLVLELNGRRQVVSRAAMEIEIDGYTNRFGN